MGTHGRTGLTRLLMGSMTERVLRVSPVPLPAVRMQPVIEKKKTGPKEESKTA
jgi:hypothetical protein